MVYVRISLRWDKAAWSQSLSCLAGEDGEEEAAKEREQGLISSIHTFPFLWRMHLKWEKMLLGHHSNFIALQWD